MCAGIGVRVGPTVSRQITRHWCFPWQLTGDVRRTVAKAHPCPPHDEVHEDHDVDPARKASAARRTLAAVEVTLSATRPPTARAVRWHRGPLATRVRGSIPSVARSWWARWRYRT